ncbi:MAG TPA: tetratricopeptide repeat protein [Thermohalobaculum sp.]|nr:tetratricopeptide repeat protein [Thermohalobaculum sp.]
MIKRMAVGMVLAVATLALGACESVSQRPDPLAGNVIDEANLSDLMLQAGDPEDAVAYFEESLAREPDRTDFRRGLAISLVRAKRLVEAARVYQELVTLDQDEPADRLEYAFVLIRLDRFDEATTVALTLPDGMDSPRRHVLDGMVADQAKDWETADAAYGKAEKLSTRPAKILNNWGVSKMARGDLQGAAATFERALAFDSRLFSAKNNLTIVRGLQGNYTLPIIPLVDEERAILLNNLGIIAMRQGDERMAKGLFAAAVEAHPQHYSGAADRLAALEANVQY